MAHYNDIMASYRADDDVDTAHDTPEPATRAQRAAAAQLLARLDRTSHARLDEVDPDHRRIFLEQANELRGALHRDDGRPTREDLGAALEQARETLDAWGEV